MTAGSLRFSVWLVSFPNSVLLWFPNTRSQTLFGDASSRNSVSRNGVSRSCVPKRSLGTRTKRSLGTRTKEELLRAFLSRFVLVAQLLFRSKQLLEALLRRLAAP